MLQNYFRLAFRNFFRNKVTFIINLLGMGIALGVCIAAYVNFEFSAGFDKTQENAERLYRIGFVHESDGKEIPYGVAPMPVGALIRENLPGNGQVIRYISRTSQFRIGDEVFQKEFIYADPDFTKIFTMERLYGSLALTKKSNILISDKLAFDYFGTTEAVGKELTQLISGKTREFTVTGVYKAFPFNSSFRFDLISTFDNYFVDPSQQAETEQDWRKWSTVFLYLPNPSAIDPITKQMAAFVKPQNEARPELKARSYYVEPFIGMPGRALRERNQGHWFNMPMPPAAVLAPFCMAGFLLLVACFNFTNNAIAVAGKRLKEIGIRKVVGGKRKELIIQFLSETLVFSTIALGLSLILAEYFVDGWNGMWSGIELKIRYTDNLPFIAVLGGLTIVSALLAGAYPAFYISSFRPIEVLRDKIKFGGTNWFTKSLLVFQFSISLAAVIFALGFYVNSKFQKEFDLGYSYQSIIQVPLESPDQFDKLRNVLANNALIKTVAGSEHHIYSSSTKAAVKTDKQVEKEVDILNVGDDYFRALNVRVISGRGFERDKASDRTESIIVNEEFGRFFNLTNPVGQHVTLNDSLSYYVVGVVKDVYLRALFEPLAPMAFRYAPAENYRYLVASTDEAQLVAVNDQIRAEWKKLFPASLYTGRLMEERMVMALEHFDNVVILYTFMGLVAIIMSVSGLFGLMSLNLQKRTKELGIRKILGAPLHDIVYQASKLFLVVMFFSFILGSLMGMVMVNGLMNTVWEYYEKVNIGVISLAVVILFTIATVTVASRIFTLTIANPAEALKHE